MPLLSSSNRRQSPKSSETWFKNRPAEIPAPPKFRYTQALTDTKYELGRAIADRFTQTEQASNNLGTNTQSSQWIRHWIRSTQRHCSTKTPQSSKNNPLAKRTTRHFTSKSTQAQNLSYTDSPLQRDLPKPKVKQTQSPECSKTWSKYRPTQHHIKTRFKGTRYSTFKI